MNDPQWEKALGLISSNSRALAALLDKVSSERRFNNQMINSNARAIAA